MTRELAGLVAVICGAVAVGLAVTLELRKRARMKRAVRLAEEMERQRWKPTGLEAVIARPQPFWRLPPERIN